MIRAPVANTIVGVAKTFRQILRRRSAFEEAIGELAPRQSAPSAPPQAPAAASALCVGSALVARDVSSVSLWLLTCRRVRRSLASAFAAGDSAATERHLARFGELLVFGEALSRIGILRPTTLCNAFTKAAGKWYTEALRQGVDQGLIVPGTTRGVPAVELLHVRLEPSTSELFDREEERCRKLNIAVQKGMSGSGYLSLSDDDLVGLTDKMKSIWANPLGSVAVWRSSKYKVPIGRDALQKIGAFCQNAQTRTKIFEAYYAGFGPDADEAALDLMRTRRELAKRLGFNTWADYQLRPLSVGDAASAHKLMDRYWRDMQPTLTPYYKKMEALGASVGAIKSSRPASDSSARALSQMSHADAAFFKALITREVDTWRLAEYFPASKSLPKLLDVVGRAYNVHFRELPKPDLLGRLATGWHKSVRIYEVRDGPASLASASSQKLGYVYLDVYARQDIFGRANSMPPNTLYLCRGHAYVSLNFAEPGYGQNKLFNPEEVEATAHELGHAVHMLCHKGGPQDFHDLPLDVLELPSTLAETIAMSPGAMAQYAGHWSSGALPPDGLVHSCQRDLSFYLRYLQSAHVSLGLHSEAFDPHSATAEDLRRASVALWQRYSPITAHPAFTPLGEDAGVYIGQGSTHIAYLLCYVRVDSILHGKSSASASARPTETVKKWLNPQFAGQVRSQLLDRDFPGERLASLLPPLQGGGARVLPHPLPPASTDASSLFGRIKPLAAA